MRRLNESATFLSDVSVLSEEELEEVPLKTGPVQIDGKCLHLAEMFNESATWIDCDMSESDADSLPANDALEPRHQGVIRSFSY